MRALVVQPGPAFSVMDVARGWVKGLRANGITTVDFNFNDRLGFYSQHPAVETGPDAARLAAKGIEAACYEVWPDVVVIISGFFIPRELFEIVRARGHKLILVHTESPYEDDRQIPRAAFADLNVLNDPTNLHRFAEAAPSLYVPHSYDPDIHHPQPATPEAASEFCFVGTGYKSRIEFFEQVNWSGIDAAFGGNWQQLEPGSPLRPFLAHDIGDCCPNDQAAVLYASTKASANLYRKEASESADGWAMGPREVELAAIGAFFLREPRGEGDEVLGMLPTFTCPGDFEEQLRWWLAHDRVREDAARLARLAVADRTFTNNVAAALRACGF